MKYFKFLLVFVFVSCAGPRTVYDYDDQADFNQYKTFRFFDDIKLSVNEIEAKRIFAQLENAIVEKGLAYDENPAIYVDVQLNQFEAQRNSVGIGFGSYGRHSGISLGGQIPINSNTLTKQFTIDFVDAKNDKLVWRGFYEGNFQSNVEITQKEQLYAEAFKKLLSKYPPKK
ncbi:DUF4136 domain-containing protein [Lutibacter sp.]|uniref:DUF4136 domain-containing protein n=1 Tax=Lutibacter sp. TaxID=1925666 RepID=UPI003562C3CC